MPVANRRRDTRRAVKTSLTESFTAPSAATVAPRAPGRVWPVLARQVRPVRSSLRFLACALICLEPRAPRAPRADV